MPANINVRYVVDKTQLKDSRAEITALTEELKISEQEAEKLAQKFSKVGEETKKAAGSSINLRKQEQGIIEQLRKKEEELTRARDKSTDPKKIQQYNRELADTKGKIQELTSVGEKQFSSLNGILKQTALLVASAFAVDAIVGFGRSAVETFANFQQALSSLSAITGATGEDLEFYKQQAAEIGATTTLSASQAVEAFKLIGSAKPELLKNKEALAEVTREAVALAEAAEIDLPIAAQSLAGALNQFQLPASEASRVINALAAGSKEGAAAIPDISAAIDKFGVSANSFNVSFEESVGLVETLAEFNIKGAESGTALRNVLGKLQSAKALPKEALETLKSFGVNLDIVTDSTIPLEERLNEVAKISGDATALVKVFGIENKTAGEIILSNVSKFKNYTQAVTGTSTAYEQQKTNTDNLIGDLKGLESATEAFKISLVEGLDPSLRALVQGFTEFVLILKSISSFLAENKELLILLATAVLALNANTIVATANILRQRAAIILDTISKQASILATGGLSAASTRLFAILRANPYGAIIAVVGALIAAYFALTKRTDELQKAANEATAELRSEQELFNAKIERLKTLEGQEEKRKQLIDEINKQYKDYLPNLISEKDTLEEINKKQAEANELYAKRAKLLANDAQIKLVQERIAALRQQQEDILINLRNGDNTQFLKDAVNVLAETPGAASGAAKAIGLFVDSSSQEIKKIQEQIKTYDALLQQLLKTGDQLKSDGAPVVPIVDEEDKKKLDDLNKALLLNQIKNANELKRVRLQNQIDEFKREIDAEDTLFEDREELIIKIANLRKQLNTLDTDEQIKLLNLQRDASTDYYGERALIVEKNAEQEKKINQEVIDAQKASLDKYFKLLEEKEKKRIEEALKNIDNLQLREQRSFVEKEKNQTIQIADEYRKQVQALDEALLEKNISTNQYYKELEKLTKEFEKEIADTELNSKRDALQNDIKILEQKRDIYEQGSEERLKIEIDLLNKEKALYDLELDAFRKMEEGKTKEAKRQEEQRAKISEAAQELGRDLLAASFELGNFQRDQDLQNLQVQKEQELALVADNEAAKAFIEQKFRFKELQIMREQARAEKERALFEIAINTGLNAVKLFAQTVPPGILSALALAQGGIQAALVASRPLPAFRDGELNIKGPGSGTSDSIIARLSRGESVMTARETADYFPTLKAIREGKVSKEVLNAVSEGKIAETAIAVRESQAFTDKNIVKAIKKNKPAESNVYVNFDDEGVSTFMESKGIRKKVLNKRMKL